MAKFPKVKLNKIITFFGQAPRVIASRAFLSFLALFLVSLIIGGIIFYQYNILTKRKEVAQLENPIQFKEKTYKNVLSAWQEREELLKETGTKKYFDIFKVKPISQPVRQPVPPKGSNDYFLFKFYESKGELLPSIEDRAKIWENFGFGPASGYVGEFFQNEKLLEALKQEDLQK